MKIEYENDPKERRYDEALIGETSRKAEVSLSWTYLFEIIKDAIPSTFGLLFVFITETINIIFIGRYNDTDLISGIGIGTLYFNATGYILGAGLIGGLDTLCSQAFGAKKYELMGIFANIARISVFGFFLLVSLPFIIFSKPILDTLGQFEEVTGIASRFCFYMIPSLFFALQYNTSLRYLQAMNIFLPGMFITLSTAVLHPLWCHIFIDLLQLDVAGAGISMSITQLMNLIIISIYIHKTNPCPKSYFFIDSRSLDWDLILDYLKKAIPASILFAADWLGFEILTLMSSYLSPLSLASNVCLFNFITLIFMLPMGLSFASTTLVGNSIGANDSIKAKTYATAALIAGVFMVGILTILVYLFKDRIPYLYTSDDRVAAVVTSLLGIYICFSVMDAIQIILHGIIKGLGKQKLASIVALIVLYPINIPLAYCFGFVWGYGVQGLWYSQLISVFLMMSSYAIICILVDWNMVAKKAIEGFNKEEADVVRRHSKIN